MSNENPDVHEIEVGGEKFLVTGQMREAIEKERKEKERSAIAPPRSPIPQAPELPPQPGYAPEPNFFDDPDRAVDNRIQRAKTEWREELNREREIEAWWSKFFGKYQALSGKKVLVQTIMQQHLPELEKLQEEKSADAAMEHLAKIARDELVLDVKDHDKDSPQPIVEGGNMVGHPAVTEQEPESAPVTLGSILKKRFDRRNEVPTSVGNK